MVVSYEKELNKEQQNIVFNAKGPTLILAGPGSGKTRTIIYKICKLIEDGADPHSILLLTFTNKAAEEMKKRTAVLVGESAKFIQAGTFHHFCHRVLRSNAHSAKISKNFTIVDEEDAQDLLKKIIKAENITNEKGKLLKQGEIRALISLSKLRMQPVASIIEMSGFSYLKKYLVAIEKVAQKYEITKRQANCVDFDDLLVYTYLLLRENRQIQEQYQNKYAHILVDEFQDTDKLQGAILELLYVPQKTESFIVVGDEAQSIYSFRGAEVKNILEFKEKYGAHAFYLLTNYRSTSEIVNLVNESIKNSKEAFNKKIQAHHTEKALEPLLITAQDRKEEAWIVGQKIEAHLKNNEQISVLFRSTYHAAELELELLRKKIDYELRGGIRFAEQRHIKDLLALARAVGNKHDITATKRLLMLFPSIGEKTAEKMGEEVAASLHDTFFDAIQTIKGIPSALLKLESKNAAALLSSFYESFYAKYLKENFDDANERIGDIETLIGAAATFESIEEFLASCMLTPPDKNKEKKVILSTIHQAKGLEWDTVFIISLADGLFPSVKATYLEEERRLFYVAASRAKKHLYLTYPLISNRFYGWEEINASLFVRELPRTCYKITGEIPSTFTTADQLYKK